MTLRVLDIPPDPQELAEWLEHQVVDFRLGELVKELTDLRTALLEAWPSLRAEHANSDGELSATSLPALLGDYRGAVLAKGLAVLPADRLRALLRQPLLLLELQRLVFVQGGDYWEQVGPASSELEGMVSEAQERLQSQLPDEPRRDSWFPLSWNRWASIASLLRPVTAGLAAAAAILLVVVMYQHYNVSTGPGGNEEVAEARQREAVALATHIAEYRRACSAFIMSGPKRPAPTSRDRYRVLAGNLDGQLRGRSRPGRLGCPCRGQEDLQRTNRNSRRGVRQASRARYWRPETTVAPRRPRRQCTGPQMGLEQTRCLGSELARESIPESAGGRCFGVVCRAPARCPRTGQANHRIPPWLHARQPRRERAVVAGHSSLAGRDLPRRRRQVGNATQRARSRLGTSQGPRAGQPRGHLGCRRTPPHEPKINVSEIS